MALRNDITNYISELRSNGQFKSALAKLITSSTSATSDSRASGNLWKSSKF